MPKHYSIALRSIAAITLIAFVWAQTALGYEGRVAPANLRQIRTVEQLSEGAVSAVDGSVTTYKATHAKSASAAGAGQAEVTAQAAGQGSGILGAAKIFLKRGAIAIPATIALMLAIQWFLYARFGLDYALLLKAKNITDISDIAVANQYFSAHWLDSFKAMALNAVGSHIFGAFTFATRDTFGQFVVRFLAGKKDIPLKWQPDVSLKVGSVSFLFTGIKIVYFPLLELLKPLLPLPEFLTMAIIGTIPVIVGYYSAKIISGVVARSKRHTIVGQAPAIDGLNEKKLRIQAGILSRIIPLLVNPFIFRYLTGNYRVAAETLQAFFNMGILVSGGSMLCRDTGKLPSELVAGSLKNFFNRSHVTSYKVAADEPDKTAGESKTADTDPAGTELARPEPAGASGRRQLRECL